MAGSDITDPETRTAFAEALSRDSELGGYRKVLYRSHPLHHPVTIGLLRQIFRTKDTMKLSTALRNLVRVFG